MKKRRDKAKTELSKRFGISSEKKGLARTADKIRNWPVTCATARQTASTIVPAVQTSRNCAGMMTKLPMQTVLKCRIGLGPRFAGTLLKPRRVYLSFAVVLALSCTTAMLAYGQQAEASEQVPTTVSEQSFLKDGTLDVEAVVKHFEDLYRSESSISVAELIVTRPRRKRTLRMKTWTQGQEKALIVILAPAREKGTATLKVDKNLWNYLPRIKRTIRIPPSMMLASWMGSDFTNDDLVRESSYSKDYVYKLVGPSQDPAGWLIRFDAKPGVVGLWNRFELVVSEDGRVPLKAEYYDRKDRFCRELVWDRVKKFDGRPIPSHLTLVPQDVTGHRTEMVYYEIDFDVEVPDSTFSLSRLERNW